MKRKTVKRNQQQTKVEVQQLSPRDIKAREEEYRKDLKDFEGGLIAGERFKKDGIIRLAKDLEKAGTVEMHKISIRITADLKPMIDRGSLAKGYIHNTLDEKYKAQRGRKSGSDKQQQQGQQQTSGQDKIVFAGQTTTPSQTQSQTATTTTTTTTPQPKPKTPAEIEFDKYVAELYDFVRSLTQLLTGLEVDKFVTYSNNIELVANTKSRRIDVAMRLRPLDLNTIYDDCKRIKVILDDFVDRLSDERNSRRQKQEMISE